MKIDVLCECETVCKIIDVLNECDKVWMIMSYIENIVCLNGCIMSNAESYNNKENIYLKSIL